MPIDIESPGTAPNTRPRRRPGTITSQTVISAESREIAPINGLRSGINFFLYPKIVGTGTEIINFNPKTETVVVTSE